MSNAHKIIKNFTSDKFSPELKEKLWKWLVDSSEQAEKDEALMELWEDQNFKADASTERSYINGKTNCSTFTKHFVPNLILLTQNKMCILIRWFHLFTSFVYLCISLA